MMMSQMASRAENPSIFEGRYFSSCSAPCPIMVRVMNHQLSKIGLSAL